MGDDAGPVFSQLNLVVSDMTASVAFYRRLGLRIDDSDPVWAPHHNTVVGADEFDFDLDSIEFASTWNRGWPGGAGGPMGVVTFRVPTRDEVDRRYGELTAAGHPSQQEPYDAFWGARFAIVEDPDGNAVGLMSPVDAAFRSTPEPPGTR